MLSGETELGRRAEAPDGVYYEGWLTFLWRSTVIGHLRFGEHQNQ